MDDDESFGEEAQAAPSPPQQGNDIDMWVNIPPPHPDVEFKVVFPGNQDMKLKIGEPVAVLVGITNNFIQPINVSFAIGSLNSPFDYSFMLQKFQPVQYSFVVEADEERSFEYIFLPAENVEPLDYIVSLTSYYTIQDNMFANTFFNGTVDFVADSTIFTADTFTTLTLVGIIIGALPCPHTYQTLSSLPYVSHLLLSSFSPSLLSHPLFSLTLASILPSPLSPSSLAYPIFFLTLACILPSLLSYSRLYITISSITVFSRLPSLLSYPRLSITLSSLLPSPLSPSLLYIDISCCHLYTIYSCQMKIL